MVDNISFSIIGVAAEQFVEPKTYYIKHLLTDVWFPWDYNYISAERRKETGSMSLDTMFLGRTINGLSAAQVEETITPLVNLPWKEMVAEFDYFTPLNIKMKLTPLKDILIGDATNIVMALIAGVVGTLFIAVANIANLFMARTAELQGSYSIHASLGASKSQLFKTILVESAILMFLALVVAIGVTLSGFQLMSTHLLELLPRVNELSFNLFSLGITVLMFVIFAWLFAKLSLNIVDYQNINSQLQSGSKGGRKQVSKRKRRFIIVSQISIATLLVFINLNLFIDAWQVINDPLSIDIENSTRVEMSIDPTITLSDDERIQINKEIQAALLTLPQVNRVSIADGSVFNGGSRFREVKVKDSETTNPSRSRSIDENYFSIYQQQLLAGDFFSNADIKDENKVIIINEIFAQKIAPNGSAIGLIIDFNGESTYTVKGVVKSFKVPGEIDNDNLLYFPGITPKSRLVIQLKKHTSLSRETFASLLKTVTSKYRVQVFESDIASQKKMLFIHFMILTATGSLALLTFFLAAIGLYGVLSYSTQLRQFEIGTRMAVGAKRADLIKLIIKDNVSAILFGVLFSIAMLLLLTFVFSEQVSQYLTLQLLPVFIVTLAMISMLSLFACYVPLRQYINKPVIHALKGNA